MTDKITKIKEYLKENPELLTSNYAQTAKIFDTNYEQIRGIARKIREDYKTNSKPSKDTKDLALEGTLTKAKTWQLPNGEWRESLTFAIDYEKNWDKFRTSFLEDLKKLSPSSDYRPKIVELDNNNSICLEISLPDLHFGKGDVNELVDNFIYSVVQLLRRAELTGVKIERILLPIGNDGLNSEGKRYTTTAGTPQRDTVDWRESFREYWSALVAVITVLEKTYPIDILVIPGNHDCERMFYVGDCLTAYFHNNNNVKIVNTGNYRLYYEYGVNMLMFTHGDKEKLADLPLIMATEQPAMFARTKYREVHMGHFHKEKVNEFRGIKTRFLPSICTTDEWHKMMGYSHQRSAQAFLWNKTGGLDGFFQINIL